MTANFLKNNIIIIAVVGGSIAAMLFPAFGQKLDSLKLISPLIIIVFICQGAGIKKLKSNNFTHYSKALLIGFFISQVAAPILAYISVKVMNWDTDSMVGFILICTMAPTLVSGTIIAEQAGGDRTASLILTIVINILAVFMIPFNLNWTLGTSVNIAIIPLLTKLVYLVLIPAIVGHFIRLNKESFISKHKTSLKYLPIACLALVIYISMSRQVESINQLTLHMLGEYSLVSLCVHLILLIAAFKMARLFKNDEATARSVAICCSQKTIPITVAIWSSSFSHYPLALLPGIVFHLCQIYCDGIIAKQWSRRKK